MNYGFAIVYRFRLRKKSERDVSESSQTSESEITGLLSRQTSESVCVSDQRRKLFFI
jgi:hypothetical protein